MKNKQADICWMDYGNRKFEGRKKNMNARYKMKIANFCCARQDIRWFGVVSFVGRKIIACRHQNIGVRNVWPVTER